MNLSIGKTFLGFANWLSLIDQSTSRLIMVACQCKIKASCYFRRRENYDKENIGGLFYFLKRELKSSFFYNKFIEKKKKKIIPHLQQWDDIWMKKIKVIFGSKILGKKNDLLLFNFIRKNKKINFFFMFLNYYYDYFFILIYFLFPWYFYFILYFSTIKHRPKIF